MKKISAILIACFLLGSASQALAQRIIPQTEITEHKNISVYTFLPTDNVVIFSSVSAKSECKLPAPQPGKTRILRIINRRSSEMLLTIENVETEYIKIPYKQTIQLMTDGTTWFVLNKSY
jgi:hypothetical protein